MTPDFKFQVGALQRNKGLKSITAFDFRGWIDGARVILNTDLLGEVIVTAGALGENDKTNIWERDLDLDYVEVRMKKEVFENYTMQLGYEKYDGTNFISFASNYEMEYATKRVLKVLTEALYDVDTDKLKASVGFAAE